MEVANTRRRIPPAGGVEEERRQRIVTLAEIITNANVGEDVDISEHTVYASVKFWYHAECGYCYNIKCKGTYNRKISPLMSDGWKIKFWKRLDSAKRYFLKMYA